MKFLTIRQPWAQLIAVGAKHIETRPFSTKYRGPLAIHAGLAKPTIHTLPGFTDVTGESIAGDADPCWLDLRAYPGVPMPLQLGAVVAVCDLVDVVPIVDVAEYHGKTVYLNQHDDSRAPLWLRCDGDWTDVSDQLPFGDFTPGRFAWLLDNVRPIEPVPMKGAQGLRDLPADVEDILAVRWAIGGGAWSEQKLWFVYDPEDGVEFFATEAEAVAEAESHIDGFLCDTWDESVESLIVGRATHWAERVDVVHPDDPRWAEVACDRARKNQRKCCPDCHHPQEEAPDA